jgi:hypothetical protein
MNIQACKKHKTWQRNALGIKIFMNKVALQKLNYLFQVERQWPGGHQNPISGRWNLAKDAPFSSAPYYATGQDRFDFLHHIIHYFEGKQGILQPVA